MELEDTVQTQDGGDQPETKNPFAAAKEAELTALVKLFRTAYWLAKQELADRYCARTCHVCGGGGQGNAKLVLILHVSGFLIHCGI